jgi:hypothetical protein
MLRALPRFTVFGHYKEQPAKWANSCFSSLVVKKAGLGTARSAPPKQSVYKHTVTMPRCQTRIASDVSAALARSSGCSSQNRARSFVSFLSQLTVSGSCSQQSTAVAQRIAFLVSATQS